MKVTIGKYQDYNKKTKKTPKRVISVKIDNWDTWSMDATLAEIVVPMLTQLKKTKQGFPGVILSDEYNTLVSSKEYWDEKKNGPLHKKEKIMFQDASKEWNGILDKMIFSFKEAKSCYKGEDKYYKGRKLDNDGRGAYYVKVQEGFDLFGKYYMNLWD